jgi:hypothetical protein
VKAADQCSRLNAGQIADIERPAVLHAAEIATREIASAPARRALFSNSNSTRNKRSFSARVEFKRSTASMANISRKKAHLFRAVFSDKSVSPTSYSTGVAPRPACLFDVRGGAVIPLDRKKIECDEGAVDLFQTPHSRRSRGALVVRRPATDTPLLGVPPRTWPLPFPRGRPSSRANPPRASASAAKLSAVALLPVYLRLPLTSRIRRAPLLRSSLSTEG